MKFILMMLIIFSVALAQAAPSAQPLAKTGSCPAQYVTSGGYCKPTPSARFSLPKKGGCPSGYQSSGAYCTAGKSARMAVVKTGVCPTGWQVSGNYCLEE